MDRLFRNFLTLGLALIAVGWAADVAAQGGPADAKRNLKAGKIFYKVPGLIEVDIRAMKSTLMLTGYVPTEEHKAKADELAKKVRGIKDIRNRIRVREPDVAAMNDDQIIAKLDEKIEDMEDLARARRKIEITSTDGNVVISGKLGGYDLAGALISRVRDIRGVKTIDFEKLKY